ncbi:unnamed protein product [Paramecium pentaurelia]|uniref:Uncharacterized protein n=1 Tax=Paramecium pentaurelia TaxID=43138 RepID=A0A8S1UP62_9CILI|nr:unnamed protein product [Paramecium pentaurelia]
MKFSSTNFSALSIGQAATENNENNQQYEFLYSWKHIYIFRINSFDLTKVNGWHLERMRYRTNNMINKLKKYICLKKRISKSIYKRRLIEIQAIKKNLIKLLSNLQILLMKHIINLTLNHCRVSYNPINIIHNLNLNY